MRKIVIRKSFGKVRQRLIRFLLGRELFDSLVNLNKNNKDVTSKLVKLDGNVADLKQDINSFAELNQQTEKGLAAKLVKLDGNVADFKFDLKQDISSFAELNQQNEKELAAKLVKLDGNVADFKSDLKQDISSLAELNQNNLFQMRRYNRGLTSKLLKLDDGVVNLKTEIKQDVDSLADLNQNNLVQMRRYNRGLTSKLVKLEENVADFKSDLKQDISSFAELNQNSLVQMKRYNGSLTAKMVSLDDNVVNLKTELKQDLSIINNQFKIFSSVLSSQDGNDRKNLLYRMNVIHLLGGNISDFLKKKTGGSANITLIGDSDLVKHAWLDLNYAGELSVCEAFSDHFVDKPLINCGIVGSIKNFQENERVNGDIILICDFKKESFYNYMVFKKDKEIFFLSEIVDSLYIDHVLHNPLLQIRKKTSLPVVFLFFPSVKRVVNQSKNEEQLLQRNIKIQDVRKNLKKDIVDEIPESIKRYSTNIEYARNITDPYSYSEINGITKLTDKQTPYVNVINGVRKTCSQPDEYDGTIYFFGNSKIFGIGSEDKDTIESHFQQLLNSYVEQNNCPYRLVLNYANTASQSFLKMIRLINSIQFQKNDILIVPGLSVEQAREKGFIVCEPQSSFNRPHNMGEVFIDSGSHLNSEGNKKVAECLLKTFLENDLLSGNYQNKNITQSEEGNHVEHENEYNVSLKNYKTMLSQIRKQTLGKIGSIVMNCNPFTLGHLYLIEYAASMVKHLFIFVVEEDKSIFPFKDRLELVKAGTADIKNVTVLPSGQFIISSLTFADYFDKAEIQDKVVDPSYDVELFAKEIASTLDITIRFAGEEPLDKITKQYNDAMRQILPQYGIQFEVIPRKEHDGEVISASRVRKFLETEDFEAIAKLVPETTLNYLKARSLGVLNINKMLEKITIFKQCGGDYTPNYLVPKTWNEKVGYYVINYISRSPSAFAMGHKYLVKQWIEKWVGEQYVVPTFGVWDNANDIDWDVLPKSFVLKFCLGVQSKYVYLVQDKNEINKQKIIYALQHDIDSKCKGYKKKRIIAEKLLLNSDNSLPYQYKFYCGRGKPLVGSVYCYSPNTLNEQSSVLFYNIQDWQKLPVRIYLFGLGKLASNDGNVERPKCLDEMIQIASELSSHFPLSRIDLYSVDNKVYVGEITLAPSSGNAPIHPSEWDSRFGEEIEVLSPYEIEELIKSDKLLYSLDEIK